MKEKFYSVALTKTKYSALGKYQIKNIDKFLGLSNN